MSTSKLTSFKEYTGAEINAANIGPLVKLTSADENHNGFVFHTGRNTDSVPFNPIGECTRGGMYFCKMKNAYNFFNYNSKRMVYFRYVTLPENARVYVERGKYKTDCFILSEREEIFTSREMLLATIDRKNMIRKLKYIKFFSLPVFDDEIYERLVANGVLHDDVPKEYRTHDALMNVIQTPFHLIAYSTSTIRDYFPSGVFDDESNFRMLQLTEHATIPVEQRTKTLFDKLVTFNMFGTLKGFPDEFFTPEICNNAFVSCRNHNIVRSFPLQFRTAAMLSVCIKERSLRILSDFPDGAFTSSVQQEIANMYRCSSKYDNVLKLIPPGILTFDMLCTAVKREKKDEIALFPRELFPGNSYERIVHGRWTRSMYTILDDIIAAPASPPPKKKIQKNKK